MTESISTTGIRLGLCCIFLEQPIKFRNTTVKSISGMNRDAALVKLSGQPLDDFAIESFLNSYVRHRPVLAVFEITK